MYVFFYDNLYKAYKGSQNRHLGVGSVCYSYRDWHVGNQHYIPYSK
jgi:hypothetical protein